MTQRGGCKHISTDRLGLNRTTHRKLHHSQKARSSARLTSTRIGERRYLDTDSASGGKNREEEQLMETDVKQAMAWLLANSSIDTSPIQAMPRDWVRPQGLVL